MPRGGADWPGRACADRDEERFDLDGATGAAEMAFVANGSTVVLNDRRSGRIWAAGADYGLIDNWDALLENERDEETVEKNDPDSPPELEKSQVPPVATDDELGARPGRTSLLPVLLNDYDANGDALVIDGFDGELPAGARLDRVSNNQQLQLTLDEEASGPITFGYTVGDGHGATAHAVVEVAVRDPDENAPPVQQRGNRASVETAGRVTTAVLEDWIDPDGDPFFLRSASVEEPDRVSSTPEGIVVFDEGGGAGSTRTVGLQVSDGREVSGGVLTVLRPRAGRRATRPRTVRRTRDRG